MTDAEQDICKDIRHFILFELTDKLDETAFTQTTMTNFGSYLFDVIKRNVPNSTDDFIKVVIRAIDHKGTEHVDYYLRLCYSVLRFNEIPRKVYIEYLRRYAIVFVNKYRKISTDTHSQIAALNAVLVANADSIKSIISVSNSALHITKDIRNSEKNLSELYKQCNDLRTQKEMLQYILEYLNECLSKFCNLEDKTIVLDTLRKKALQTAKDDHLSIDDEFKYYEEILEIVKANIDDIFRIIHTVKLQPFYDDIYKRGYETGHLDNAVKEKILQSLKDEYDALPRIAVLEKTKSTDVPGYRALLDGVIRKYDVPGKVVNKINSSVSIGGRRSILLKAVNLFNIGEYDVFNNIVPIQLEGLFADFLKDGTVFHRFSNLNIYPQALLREKIVYIKNLGVDIYPEAVMYFGFYFNNLVRNKIAHGNYTYDNNDHASIFAMEMLLDLNYLLHMLSRKSETERMYRLIHRYKDYMATYFKTPNYHFEFLFNDLTRNRIHMDYDNIERISPMQFTYWLINPYYEEIYSRVGDVAILKELRTDFVSNDFWLFVLAKLNDIIKAGYDYINIDKEFFSVVKGLFSCNIPADTKSTLAKVNAALSQIEKMG